MRALEKPAGISRGYVLGIALWWLGGALHHYRLLNVALIVAGLYCVIRYWKVKP